jgi:hypothetical protein
MTLFVHQVSIEGAQDGWDDHDGDGNKIKPVKRVICHGGLNAFCDKYGVQFETCICQDVPVKSLIIHKLHVSAILCQCPQVKWKTITNGTLFSTACGSMQ